MDSTYSEFIKGLQSDIQSLNHSKYTVPNAQVVGQEGSDLSSILKELTLIFHSNSNYLDSFDIKSEFTSLIAFQIAAILANEKADESMKMITKSTSDFLKNLFDLPTFKSVFFSRNEHESLIQACRVALDRKFETLQNEGFPVIFSRPPVFYIPHSSDSIEIANRICQNFLLPSGCVRVVPQSLNSTSINVEILENLIKEDIGDGKTPCLVLSRGVTPITGEMDNLSAIRKICDSYNIWMHFEGDQPALFLLKRSSNLNYIVTSDSISFNPGRWFTLIGTPHLTFFRSSMVNQSPHECFSAVLNMYMILKNNGSNKLKSKIQHIIDISKKISDRLASSSYVNMIERKEETQYILFRFQFPSGEMSQIENKVTKQICLSLLNYSKTIGIDTIEKEGFTYIRFQPFSQSTTLIQEDQLNSFLNEFTKECELILSTWKLQTIFKSKIDNKELKYSDVQGEWFGLGAIRCIPSYIGEGNNISDEVNKDIDILNESIVEELSKFHPKLFAKGKTTTNHTCILIGIDTEPMTEEKIDIVIEEISKKASELEKSGKFIDNLAQVIRKGISEAESQLQIETENKIMEEGFLKYIPIVGSIYSMFASTEEVKKPAGRTFSLPQAKLDKVSVISKENVTAPTTPTVVSAQAPVTQPYSKERAVAIAAVEHACKACKKVFNSLVNSETVTKKDNSPVTVADFCSQAIINLSLLSSFPDDLIVAEEDSQELKLKESEKLKNRVVEITNEILFSHYSDEAVLGAIDRGNHVGGKDRFWTLDPIDGTKGFLRGEQYAVCLALIVNGEVVLGVMGCPNLPLDMNQENSEIGCIFVATKNGGSYERPLSGGTEKLIKVSSVTNTAESNFCESVEAAHSSHGDASKVADLLNITKAPIRMDSQCKYASIARGDASIYLRLPTIKDYQEKIWDHASGYLMVKEAGGEVQDVNGKEIDFSKGRTLSENSGIVATNGKIQEQVVSAVKTVLHAKQPAS